MVRGKTSGDSVYMFRFLGENNVHFEIRIKKQFSFQDSKGLGFVSLTKL